jgi:hypothetical protein
MVERLTVRRRTAREIPRNWVGFWQCSQVNVALNAGVAAGVVVAVDAGKAGVLDESDAWGTDIWDQVTNLSPISSTLDSALIDLDVQAELGASTA